MKYEVNYPVAFHTVDIAIVKKDEEGKIDKVLLIQKHSETTTNFWRFPGGFIDVNDLSAEYAAVREAREETGMMFRDRKKDNIIGNAIGEVAMAKYIGSCKIDDP